MAAPSAMSAFSRGFTSIARSHSRFIRPAKSCIYSHFEIPSHIPVRLFSIGNPLRSLKNSRPPSKIGSNTAQTPVYKLQSQPKTKAKAVATGRAPHSKAQAHDKSANMRATGPTTPPIQATMAVGTVATRISHAYMAKLLAKGAETPLYEAPNHVWFTIGSLFTAAFCVSYAFYNSYFHVMHPPPGIPWWVPYMYGVICSTMAGMGVYFFLGPSRIISHITAVPASAVLLSKAKTVAAKESRLLVEVGIRRPLLGFDPRKIYVAPSEIGMKTKLMAPLMTMSKGELVTMERRLKEARQKEITYDKDNLMTAPFRQMGRAFMELYKGIRRMMSREGFADVTISGRVYKLDILGGWALEDGRAVDRLLAPKEDGDEF